MVDYGDINLDDYFDDDIIQGYIDLKHDSGVSSSQLNNLRRYLDENEANTSVRYFLHEHRNTTILDATVKDIFALRDWYLDEDLRNERGTWNVLTELSAVYRLLMGVNLADANPAAYVLSESDLDTDSPDRDEHTVEEIGGFIAWIPDPEFKALALVYAKTGLRRAVVVSIDLQCVHLDHDGYRQLLDEHGVELHEEIADRPDSIYIYPGFDEDDEVAGEVRGHGNKRSNDCIIPVDAELKQALLEWLFVRPRTDEEPHPLFTEQRPTGGSFGRLSPKSAYNAVIQKFATEYGIRDDCDSKTDLDIHYFRSFFRTEMKPHHGHHDGSLHRELIKHIRGDKDEGVEDDVYKEDWGVNLREPYLENIYEFGIYD